MYLRFFTRLPLDRSPSPAGVFQAAFALRDSGRLEVHEHEWLEAEMSWLRMHLKSPPVLRKDGNERALCWFHPRARRPIEKVRSIAALLADHGIVVDLIKTDDPGIVIYEDGWQVAAKPRRRPQRPVSESDSQKPTSAARKAPR